MKTFEKILNVLAKNIGYTVVLVAAVILFAIFSGGLLPGLITAGSALIGYACIERYTSSSRTQTPQSRRRNAFRKRNKKSRK